MQSLSTAGTNKSKQLSPVPALDRENY